VTTHRSTPVASHSPFPDTPGSTIVIRAITSLADFRECVALQHEVWGEEFEAVPGAILQISGYVGGITAGAFDGSGRLVGFVFGLTGVDGPKIIHWSHVLGVLPEVRDAGVGRLLKHYQRKELARRKIGEMYWTYDPLIAKNAHFNLNVLGARVARFAPNQYGISPSPLHHNLPTDRLVVVCDTTREPHEVSSILDAVDARTPILTPYPQPGDSVLNPDGKPVPRARMEIPTDFAQLLTDAPAAAKHWHTATRKHFQWALTHGYTVTGLRRDPETLRSFYILELSSPDSPNAT
jgi:predicted GNAT superfamily acetyltransferase